MYKIKEGVEFEIDHRQLKDAFPQLYAGYEEYFGEWHKRPKIKVEVSDKFYFSPDINYSGADHFVNIKYFFLINGKVKYFDCSDERNSPVKSVFDLTMPGTAVLVCHSIQWYGCYLHVGSSFVNPSMITQQVNDLDIAQTYALLLMRGRIPSARFREFSSPFEWNGELSFDVYFKADLREYKKTVSEKYGKTWKAAWEAVLQSLQGLGFVKINSAGSAQLTLNGKNKALAIEREYGRNL